MNERKGELVDGGKKRIKDLLGKELVKEVGLISKMWI